MSGKSRDLSQITDSSLVFAVDLSAAAAGGNLTLPVTLQTSPAHIDVLGWSPTSLTVSVDAAITKTVPVAFDTAGYAADGYTAADITATPSTVELTGSPQLLDHITDVLATVDLHNHKASFDVPVTPRVEFDGATITNVSQNPSWVTAHVNIQKGSAFRNLGIKPTFTGTLPVGYFMREVQFNPPVVMVSGNQRALAALTELLSTPINLDNHHQTFTDSVAVNLPRGVKLVGDDLIKVQVSIQLAQASRQFSVTPQFVNVSEGESVTAITPKAITLVVVGEEDVLSHLHLEDIKFNVDLQRALSGTNEITIDAGMFSLPAGVSVGSFTPGTLEVILSRT